jgi:hypothetical protein
MAKPCGAVGVATAYTNGKEMSKASRQPTRKGLWTA